MKKILCTLLAAIMLLSVCGCSSIKEAFEEDDSTVSSIDDNGDSMSDDEDDDDEADKPDVNDGSVPVRGAWDDDEYYNEFAELGFTLPEGWIVQSDEYIEAVVGATVDALYQGNSAQVQALSDIACVYDTVAMEVPEGDDYFSDNMIVMFENVSITGGGREYTAEQYLSAVAMNLSRMGNYSDMTEPEDMQIGDHTYSVMWCRGENAGRSFVQFYMIRMKGDYAIGITVSSDTAEKIQPIIECFS